MSQQSPQSLRRSTPGAQVFRSEPSVTIRYAFPDDAGALERLAVLDSSVVPTGQLLVAEVEGELWAAISLASGAAIADPFRRTAPLLELLQARAEQLCVPEPSRAASAGAWSGDLRRQRA